MGTIITLDNLNEPSELAPTAANFPALKHLFPCDEAVGETTLTDSVGGVVLTPDSIGAFDGTKLASMTAAVDTALTSGSWATIGSKNMLLMIMGTYDSGTTWELSIGKNGASVTRFRMRDNVTNIANATLSVSDSTNFIADGTDAIAFLYSKVHASQGINKGVAAAAGVTTATVAGNLAGFTSYAAFSGEWQVDGFTNIYGIAIFHFTAIPLDINNALLWMRNEWAAGNKTIYPGWKGRS